MLDEAHTEVHELYLKPAMTEFGPLLGLLFHDVSVIFDERTQLPQMNRSRCAIDRSQCPVICELEVQLMAQSC